MSARTVAMESIEALGPVKRNLMDPRVCTLDEISDRAMPAPRANGERAQTRCAA